MGRNNKKNKVACMVQEKTAQNSSEKAQGSNEDFYPIIMSERHYKAIENFKSYLNKKKLYEKFPLVMSDELLNCDSSRPDPNSIVELYKFLKKNKDTGKSIVELLAKNRKDMGKDMGKEYTAHESKIFTGTLSLALIISEKPALMNAEPKYEDLQNNFNYFLPECKNADKPSDHSDHFGSFSFHRKDRKDGQVINKITYKKIEKANVDKCFLKNRKDIYHKIRDIITKKGQKNGELKQLANIDIFQNYFSQTLHLKQNDLMLLIDPDVPFILSKGHCKDKKPDAKLPCGGVEYYIELSGDLDELFESYLDNCINCINGKDGNSIENCIINNETTGITCACKLDKKWYNLLISLYKFVNKFAEKHHRRDDDWEENEKKDTIEKKVTTKTSHLYKIIELIIPFIFFDKPFLICTQHSYHPKEKDIKYPERIITCSVAVDPKSNNIKDQRRWGASIPSAFNGFIKSVINSFIELDQKYAEVENIREKTEAEKSKIQAEQVAHLQGTEKQMLEITKSIEELRGKALILQNKIAPGTVGIMSLKYDLEMFFLDDQKIYVSIGSNTKKALAWATLYFIKDYLEDNDRKEIIETVITFGESTQVEQSVSTITGMHNHTDDKFINKWKEYSPILYVLAVNKNIKYLEEIMLKYSLATKNSPLEFSDENNEKRIFRMLKNIVHRPFAPEVDNDGSAKITAVQILSVALETNINYENTLKIKNNNCPINKVDNIIEMVSSESYPFKSRGLKKGIRPVDFLSPLYRLLAGELVGKGTNDENWCQATEFSLNYKNDKNDTNDTFEVLITCRGKLSRDKLKTGDDAVLSGLTGAIHGIAHSLGEDVHSIRWVNKKIDCDNIEIANLLGKFAIINYKEEINYIENDTNGNKKTHNDFTDIRIII